MASLNPHSEPHSDQRPENIKKQFENITNSNAYCWIVLLACLIGIILAFVFHEGTQYSDKFFLVLAVLAIGLIVNANQLRKNYLKKKDERGS